MRPGSDGAGLLDLTVQQHPEAAMPRSCPPEFRRKALDMVAPAENAAR